MNPYKQFWFFEKSFYWKRFMPPPDFAPGSFVIISRWLIQLCWDAPLKIKIKKKIYLTKYFLQVWDSPSLLSSSRFCLWKKPTVELENFIQNFIFPHNVFWRILINHSKLWLFKMNKTFCVIVSKIHQCQSLKEGKLGLVKASFLGLFRT